jgi:glutaryl-CoA dehydrogenase
MERPVCKRIDVAGLLRHRRASHGRGARRDRARRFVQDEVMNEIVPCHRAAKFPEHLRSRMGALRLFAPYLKEHGCAGLSYTAYGLIMQELERADSGLRSEASVQGPLAIHAIIPSARRSNTRAGCPD